MVLVKQDCTMKKLAMNKGRFFMIFFTAFIPSIGFGGDVTYLYSLSDFSGTTPYDHVKVSIDRFRNEIYVITADVIKVYNQSGMEIYTINAFDLGLGAIYDLAVDEEGNLIVLSYLKDRYSILVCNYRGEPFSEIRLKGIPEGFGDFSPNGIILKDGLLYLYSSGSMRLLIAEKDGIVKDAYDLAKMVDIPADDRGMGQLSIDHDGNILFTAPVIARAFIISPDKKVRSFGKRGSAPGRFGVPTGIVGDREGNVYVSDKLRSVVLVFDRDLRFVREFGYRGFRKDNIIVPGSLAIDEKGRLYVTQMRKRGVSVFSVAGVPK